LLALGGCAGSAPLMSGIEPIELDDVPFFPQTEYQCGPAALATILAHEDLAVDAEDMVGAVYVEGLQGSLQAELLGATRRNGLIPYVLEPQPSALFAELAAGRPVLILQNLGLTRVPVWHYAVVVGFDLARDEMVLRSGLERRHVVPLAVFERTWRRGDYWAVVVMPPDRLPHTAQETPYLQAVIGLERLRRWEEASRAYRAAAARWPESLGAQLGIGNSRYALKDIAGAEQAYRAATTTHPNSGIAFNNLAQALADRGRWREAEDAVTRALTLGGPHIGTFQATADEIRNKKNATADKRR
jgi:hypothetical protein